MKLIFKFIVFNIQIDTKIHNKICYLAIRCQSYSVIEDMYFRNLSLYGIGGMAEISSE